MQKLKLGSVLLAASIAVTPAVAQEKTALRFFTIFDACDGKVGPRDRSVQGGESGLTSKSRPSPAVEPPSIPTCSVPRWQAATRLTSSSCGEARSPAPSIRAGQVRAVDDDDDQYKWKDRFAGWIVARLQRDGRRMVCHITRGMAFWYRKDLFEKYGLSEPKSYADLEAICTKLKSENIYCASFGGKFGWHPMRLLDYFVETKCGPRDPRPAFCAHNQLGSTVRR